MITHGGELAVVAHKDDELVLEDLVDGCVPTASLDAEEHDAQHVA